jgi:integrase
MTAKVPSKEATSIELLVGLAHNRSTPYRATALPTPHRTSVLRVPLPRGEAVPARACTATGIAHRHPHDLRHRYASVQIARGVPVTQVAAQLGHSRKSLTLDTYSHVLMGG